MERGSVQAVGYIRAGDEEFVHQLMERIEPVSVGSKVHVSLVYDNFGIAGVRLQSYTQDANGNGAVVGQSPPTP